VSETRKLAAILVSDVVGYSRLAGADEDRILARLRTLRSDLIDPTIAVHHGRIVKRTGDGSIIEFRSVVDAVNCAIEVQRAMVERNAEVAPDKRIQFRVGIHLGDIVEESDGDLMGDGVNVAARLEGFCEPGRICLSEDAYRQVKSRVELEVADLGPQRLKNIAEPIRIYSLCVGTLPKVTAKPAPPYEKSVPPRLSIVVMPFANIGGEPEQDHFVDGVTESLTTDLSRIFGAFVIGRHTAFTYKGKPVDLKQIGRDLNVRYVVEGSVQREGGRMRVNVQLIDAETGSHFWSERFDKPVADLLDVQDEIVAHVANALNTRLVDAEARRAKKALNPDAMDLYFQGMSLVNKGFAPTNMSPARDYFERALEIDPDNVDALVGSAIVDTFFGAAVPCDDAGKRLSAAEVALTRALLLAPDHPMAHLCMGDVFDVTNRAGQAIGEFERALALDRNFAAAHAHIGFAKILVGRPEETEAHVHEALRLSPRDAWVFMWLSFGGLAKLALGCDEEAVTRFRGSIEANRAFHRSHFYLAASLAHLGRLKEARAAVSAGLAVDPRFTVSVARASAFSDNPSYLAGRERFIEGLRKAGLPEE
jgi:TolB-like protein/tetratricopeptide (TPR) repeat protein